MNYCDACGDRIAPDVPIERDGWTLTRHEVKRDGVPLKGIPPRCVRFLYALAQRPDQVRTHDDIVKIVSHNPDYLDNADALSKVVACHTRSAVPDAPFRTVWGRGYRWGREPIAGRRTIARGGWVLTLATTELDGEPVLAKRSAAFLYYLASASPRWLPGSELCELISPAAMDSSSVAKKSAQVIRERLSEVPFMTHPKRGYRWAA